MTSGPSSPHPGSPPRKARATSGPPAANTTAPASIVRPSASTSHSAGPVSRTLRTGAPVTTSIPADRPVEASASTSCWKPPSQYITPPAAAMANWSTATSALNESMSET